MLKPPTSYNDNEIITKLFQGYHKFGEQEGVFYANTLSTFFRQRGRMNDVYRKGPYPNSKLYTLFGDAWPSQFEKIRKAVLEYNKNLDKKDSKLYVLLSYLQGEGATFYGFFLDNSFSLFKPKKENNGDEEGGEDNGNGTDEEEEDKPSKEVELLEKELKGKRWAGAILALRKIKKPDVEDKDFDPMAITFIVSITLNAVPFFGRCAWGCALKNDVLSLTEIPLIGNNHKNYFTWSYVCKSPITESELYRTYGKGGNETTFSRFDKLRNFLINKDECQPLNADGKYTGFVDQKTETTDLEKENIEEDNTTQDIKESIEESFRIAYSYKHLVSEYRRVDERGYDYDNVEDKDLIETDDGNPESDLGAGDTDVKVNPDAKRILPKGSPVIDAMTKKMAGIPIYGPQY